ncbi:MAG: ABC transporter ATP-binding protein [Desulfobacterales bacterium]|nr:ABC transporter ATP-binding protein [Desulfobacterales bacterium]
MSAESYENEYGNAKNALELKNITKRFGDLVAVSNISLEIKEGEIFSFLGPSGCGKTTLLRCIAGLEDADEGQVLIGGEVVNQIPPYKRNCSIVFQQHALFPHMSVFDNIAFGLVEHKVPKAEIKMRVNDLVDMVNLNGMESRWPHQLSGGQQQRVALARSLVLRPAILLLDEPLAALDRKLRKEMQTELKRIQKEVGTTFMNVTHDQKEALSLSDRIAVIKDGKIIQLGTPEEIYESPRTTFVADFMGASNIFSGKADVNGDNNILFRGDIGLEILLPNNDKLEAKEIKGISIHPEVIGIALEESEIKALDSWHTVFKGRITEAFYQGDFSELTVKLNESDIELAIHLGRGIAHDKEIVSGQDVMVHWKWEHNNILYS